jgi:amino acid adenylation domain-containing protein/thioester reductase-like protein
MQTVAAEGKQNQKVVQVDKIDDVSKLQLCLNQLLEPVIKKHSDKVAIVCGDTTLTFGELDLFVNSFADALFQRGIGHGDIVGVALDRCVELVPVMLAIMKRGAAYLPIEFTLPVERINQMMENACPKLVITGANTPEAFASLTSVCCRSIEEVLQMVYPESSGSSVGDVVVRSSDLAYVMYTSGSTGKPKGVEITHGSLTNLLLSMQREPGCKAADRLLAITAVSFDVSVVDWFLPLLCGSTMVIAQRHEFTDMTALVGLMKHHQITIMQGTPAIWRMLLDSGWQGQPRLEQIWCAGEALSRELADSLLTCCDTMWNLYGVTEAAVYSCMWRVCLGQDVSIGGSIANTQLYILDEKQVPVPPGSPGELCIGGLGVGRGYCSNSKLSAARFPRNPFHPGRMYRTGDIARLTSLGTVSLMGRMDGQVKIRGHRVELGDIEAALIAHPDVSGAVVVSRDGRLVAYCVRRAIPSVNGESETKKVALSRVDRLLRPWLAERLPVYMMPAFFVEVAAFPVSINGKIDRKALPDPVAALQALIPDVMPATELERQMLLIWSRVLGHDRVSINDNFFEMGGDSLLVVRVQRELERLLGCPVPAAKLFEHYTIKTLAAYLTASSTGARPTPEATLPFRVNENHEDIAVVSMACQLPGGISTPEGFWELLEAGGDAITDVPQDRWSDVSSDASGKSYCRRGGFLSSVNAFDISVFGISPREARRLDPAQYLLLETCWEGFERAGYTVDQLRGSQTGVFIGASNILAHQSLNPGAIRDVAEVDGYTVTGSAAGTMSGRISYQFGLQGPSMTIDTACSSSLVTTHLACTALRQGECDMAVSGGISIMLNPGLHAEFSLLQGMSPDGRCRAFSADSQGTGWSEGSVVVILKRLSDAQRDGDCIHSVIRGTAVNHDGRSASLTVPSGSAQQRLIRTALAAARLHPDDIDYVETHGTATRLGDPIEATALAEVFGSSHAHREPLLIGAAKSNIGHTQAASGLVGLLKVTLSIQHNMLPQTLHVTEPTPAVDWESANMIPVLSKQSWLPQESRTRRAGVSAFGIGGTNAHIIVQEPPRQVPADYDVKAAALLPLVVPLLLSGDTDAALQMQAGKLHRHINSTVHPDSLGDVAYSLATTRSHLRRRMVLMAREKTGEVDSNTRWDSLVLPPGSETVETPRLAMLFTGQGSQWPGMGKDLCQIYPVFGEIVREVAAQFELGVPLLDVMWAEPNTTAATLLDRTDFAQPALFTLGVALWRLWQSWGVTPDFVLGHSLGELIIAHIANILDLSDACRLVAARGRLMQAQSGHHGIISLEASAAEVSAAVEQLDHIADIDIAAYNTPRQTVISGNMDAVERMKSHFAGQGRRTHTLVVGHAFHSRYMDGMLAEFRAVVDTVRFHPSRLSIISSLDGSLVTEGQLEQAQYWVQQVREPVRFNDSIQALARQGVNIFLELGPDKVLCGIGAMCLADHERSGRVAWLPSLGRGKDSNSILQRSLAHLHLRHVRVDWQAYFKPFGCRRVQLPTYAFQREFVVSHTFDAQSKVLGTSINGTSTNDTGIKGTSINDTGIKSTSINGTGIKSTSINGTGINDTPISGTGINGTSINGTVINSTSINGTSVNGTRINVNNNICRDPSGNHCTNQFEIAWHPVKTDNVYPKEIWGLITPAGSSKWTTNHVANLSQVGIQLVLVEHLNHAEKLNGLMCLWDTDADVLSQTVEIMAKALVQLQTAAQIQFKPPLVWVTHHVVGIGNDIDDHAMRLGSASLLWGLMRTARSEHPELHLRLIDLGQETTGASFPKALILETETECAVRQDRVLVPRLQRVDPVSNQLLVEHRIVRPDGAVLITGGLGDLGSRVARWLVGDHGISDLILISRQGMDAPGADALVGELSVLGARVTVMAGDVANPEFVSSIMETISKDRPLRGVVHAAGVVDSGVLSTMTQQRCETTIAPKVYGAWNLHQATRDLDLDLFMMFSSISGVMGMPGLANYAASNTFLDALAHLRCGQRLPATSVAYGPWAGDGGMVSRLRPATLSHIMQYGLDPLPPDEGLVLFQQAVASRRPLTMAAMLDLERLRAYLEEQGSGIPPLLSSLLIRNSTVTQPFSSASSSSSRHLREVLSEAEPGLHAGIMLDMTRQVVAKSLGFTHLLDVEVDRSLKEIGIDSLTAVEMRNHLAKLTGLSLSVNIVFIHATLRLLSQSLLSQLQDTDISSITKPSNSRLNMNAVRDAGLDSSIMFDNITKNLPIHPARRPESVFLTGATGFVGVFILNELLKQGITAYCLVRARNVEKAGQRLIRSLQEYGLWEPGFASLIKPVVGDMAQPLLGMSDQVFDDLAHWVDAICHSGALVDWFRPLQDYVGPNIVSAHEILRLASHGRAKAVHLMSTISTLPKHMGLELNEGDLEYGYGTSKYIAERLVAAARWRGARAAVYRLPYVTASTTTGHFRHDRGDFLHNFITGSLEMGAFPLIHADMSAVLPVDYLAKTIVAIMTLDFHRLGQDIDFLSSRAPSCAEFFKLMGGISGGRPQEIIEFSAWKQRALDYATVHPTSPLARITAVLDCYTNETAPTMFKGMPVGVQVLGGDDYPAPSINEQFVNGYLNRIHSQSSK